MTEHDDQEAVNERDQEIDFRAQHLAKFAIAMEEALRTDGKCPYSFEDRRKLVTTALRTEGQVLLIEALLYELRSVFGEAISKAVMVDAFLPDENTPMQ